MTFETFKRCLHLLAFIWIIGLLLSALYSASTFGRDDSDEQGWGSERSNLMVHTDNLTGCQYLSSSNGGLTPRLDKHGNHVCLKGDKK